MNKIEMIQEREPEVLPQGYKDKRLRDGALARYMKELRQAGGSYTLSKMF